MTKLKETQTLSTVHLSDTQKVVITKIIASPTEQVAIEEISKGRNLVAAKEALVNLGLIEVSDNSITVTNIGHQVMADENLTDESGELTSTGQKYAAVQKPNDLKTVNAPEPATNPDISGDDDLAMEGIDLFRSIDRNVLENRIITLISIQSST